MHELSVTESLLKIALDHAKKSDAKKITALNLVIGEFATMVDDSIQFYWGIIAKDTIAESAVLNFRRVPAELQCMTCFEKYHPDGKELICPRCKGVGVKIIAGEEFSLESIDVE